MLYLSMQFEVIHSYDGYSKEENFGPYPSFKEAKQKFNQLLKEKVGMPVVKELYLSTRMGDEEMANQDVKEVLLTYWQWAGDGVGINIIEINK